MKWIKYIEKLIENMGRICAWVLLILLVAIVLQVGLNMISSSITWMEELQWYLYGTSALVAMAYTMTKNAHVRVDLLHQKFGLRTKQWLETLWILFALIPLYLITLTYGWDFAYDSFIKQEMSAEPGGLPYRWIVKAFIPMGSLFLIIVSMLRAILVWINPEVLEETVTTHGD